MQSTFITSHGSHCIGGKGAHVFKLPPNVIVLMNCNNATTYTSSYFESKFWAFASDAKLHLAMAKKKLDVNAFGKYLLSLEKFNDYVNGEKNTFCIFADKCPDLLFTFEEDMFRSGIFQLPATVTVKEKKNKKVITKLTSAMFQKYGQGDEDELSKEVQRMIGAWVQIDERGELKPNEYFSVKNRKEFPINNKVDNMLSKMIKDIVVEQPDKMHFIVISACRSRQKVNMKVQEYSVTDNPYQAAIVVYDKVKKFLDGENKK